MPYMTLRSDNLDSLQSLMDATEYGLLSVPPFLFPLDLYRPWI